MSRHNRNRKTLWRLGIHPKQTGRKPTTKELANAKQRANEARLTQRKGVAVAGVA
jgi:hypothetical protein